MVIRAPKPKPSLNQYYFWLNVRLYGIINDMDSNHAPNIIYMALVKNLWM